MQVGFLVGLCRLFGLVHFHPSFCGILGDGQKNNLSFRFRIWNLILNWIRFAGVGTYGCWPFNTFDSYILLAQGGIW